jgi:hypothetical protein
MNYIWKLLISILTVLLSSCATYDPQINKGTIVLYGFSEPDWIQVKLNEKLLFEGYLSYKPSLGVSAYLPFSFNSEDNNVLEVMAVTYHSGRYNEKEETLTYELNRASEIFIQISRDEGSGTFIEQLSSMPEFF